MREKQQQKLEHGLNGSERSRGEMKPAGLTEKLMGASYTLTNELRHGFLESIYQRRYAYMLTELGLSFNFGPVHSQENLAGNEHKRQRTSAATAP